MASDGGLSSFQKRMRAIPLAARKGVKAICGLIRQAVNFGPRLVMAAPYHCADLQVSSTRTLRDPDGEHSHGVVTVEALIVEALS